MSFLLRASKGIQRIDKKNKEDFEIYHIPTLLNGKIENKNMKTVSSEV
jgi:hypothetical protein